MRCMVVNGELFYDAIEGFDYVEGFDYLLKVERYDAWPDQEEPCGRRSPGTPSA